MSTYTDPSGNHFWYDEQGSGEPLLILHPGGADSRALESLLPAFAEHFRVYRIDQRGHGRTADIDGPFSVSGMADDTIGFIERVIGGPVRLLGYSDGASVAVQAAYQRPDLVSRLVCAAGVFHFDGWYPGVITSGQEPPAFMADSYGEVSPDGRDHYAVIARKLDAMHEHGPSLTTADLARIACRTLLLFGDDDEVSLEHALAFYRALPQGELAIIPGTSHGVLVEKPTLCTSILLEFLTNDPLETFAPIRRA